MAGGTKIVVDAWMGLRLLLRVPALLKKGIHGVGSDEWCLEQLSTSVVEDAGSFEQGTHDGSDEWCFEQLSTSVVEGAGSFEEGTRDVGRYGWCFEQLSTPVVEDAGSFE